MGIRKRTFSVRKMYTVNSDYRLIEGQGIVKMWYINGILLHLMKLTNQQSS